MNSKDFCYGLIKYSSINIGDEVQCIAAMRFLPHIDEYIHRDRVNRFKSKNHKKLKLIMNAWWTQNIRGFPPSDDIEPLMTSMYIRHNKREKFLTKKVKKYFLKHSPIGCRDKSTYEWLKSENIPAYFSGCLTLTLERNDNIPKDDYILCVDTSDEVVNTIKQRTKRPVYSISRMISPYNTYEERLKITKLMLRVYQSAHCIVSPRLHVILPSLALKTPALRIIPYNHVEDGRWHGYEDFVKTVKEKDFIDNIGTYDFDNPPDNPDNYLELKKSLIETTEKFTNYNNPNSLIDDSKTPLIDLLGLLRYKIHNQNRVLYWSSASRLMKVALQKLFKIKTRWDI